MKLNKYTLLGIVFTLIVGSFFGYQYYQENKFYFAARTESNLFTLGQIEAHKGRHAEAISVYKELLTKDPKHSIALRFMIESMMKVPDKTQVMSSLERLIELDKSRQNLEFAVSVSLELKDKAKAEYFQNLLQPQ